MLHIDLDIKGMDRMIATSSAAPAVFRMEEELALMRSTFIAEAAIKRVTPVKTSRLRSSWHSRVFLHTGQIGTSVKYAPMVESGTRPHDITPTNGRALRFRIGGRWMFAKRVHHPGMRGRHMAQIGLAWAAPAILKEFRDMAQRVLDTVKGA